MSNNYKKKSAFRKNLSKIIIFAVLALIIVGFLIFNNAKGKIDEDLHAQIMSSTKDLSNTYNTYISYGDYVASHNYDFVDEEEIYLSGAQYKDNTLNRLTEMDSDNILTGNKGNITYSVDVKKAGFYNIEVGYYPSADSDKQIYRNVYINGEIPFEEAQSVNFERMWVDSNKNFLMVSDSNQAAPSQKQDPVWTSKKLEASNKMVDGSLMFWFEKGKNNITFESIEGNLGISYIKLVSAKKLLSYDEYLNCAKSEGANVINASEVNDGAVMVQAEDALTKTSAMLLPQNDRTSPLSVPYDASNIVMNTIGGSSWADSGMGITWEITVPKSGLYKIGARFLQAENRDFYSSRELKINGEVPFKEAANLTFDYDSRFQTAFFGDGEKDYYFYLKEGKNELTLTVTVGDLAFAIEQSHISVKNFNALYRRFTAVMSSDPDTFRDYQIVNSIPDMVDILSTEYYRLNKVMESLGDSIDNSAKTRTLAKMARQLQVLIKKPDKISTELKTFNDNVTAISDWMMSLDEQPLKLDYLFVCGEGYDLPKGDANFFQRVAHKTKAFIGSFTNDYRTTNQDGSKKEKTIEVWIATATRDQYDVAQKLVNNAFADKPYGVKIKMVGADTVMPATITGNGPDVAIQLNYTMPTNFAFRNAGYDLTQFADFEEVAKEFSPSAMEYFEYNGGYYALPDEMSFPVIFYRTDILKQMGMEVPETWDDYEAMIPYLQAENMTTFMTLSAGILGGYSQTVTKPVGAVFCSMLYQNGEELYRNNNTESNLDSLVAELTFKKWTEYYTRQGFPQAISTVTRFRTGDVPILIDDYTLINTLSAAAPEIDGQWSIAPMPGTIKEDGSIDKTVCINVGGAMIIKGSVEKNDTANESWEFLKWWTSKDTQLTYAKEQKSILGDAANYPVANLEAMIEMAEELGYKDTVEETLKWSRGVPQVPGGYISGRYVDNAFLSVITNYLEPVDTLYGNIRFINQEIKNKREEFGLTE